MACLFVCLLGYIVDLCVMHASFGCASTQLDWLENPDCDVMEKALSTWFVASRLDGFHQSEPIGKNRPLC
jgi:hypothetical protein